MKVYKVNEDAGVANGYDTVGSGGKGKLTKEDQKFYDFFIKDLPSLKKGMAKYFPGEITSRIIDPDLGQADDPKKSVLHDYIVIVAWDMYYQLVKRFGYSETHKFISSINSSNCDEKLIGLYKPLDELAAKFTEPKFRKRVLWNYFPDNLKTWDNKWASRHEFDPYKQAEKACRKANSIIGKRVWLMDGEDIYSSIDEVEDYLDEVMDDNDPDWIDTDLITEKDSIDTLANHLVNMYNKAVEYYNK